MSQLVRIIFALQICILFVAGCVVDDDSAADTELTIGSDVADPAPSEAVAAPDVPEAALDGAAASDAVTTKGRCQVFRLSNRATGTTCFNFCSDRGQQSLRFDDRNKICRCCPRRGL